VDMTQAASPDLFRHGGNLDAAKKLFGAVDHWLDLSTGINPVAYPVPSVSSDAWQKLPDTAATVALRRAAAACFSVGDMACLIETPGTQAILQVLPDLGKRSHVCVVGPTYNEHARCWARSGAQVTEIGSVADVPATANVVVVVNPNNPDGHISQPETLLDLAAQMAARGGLLIVDEAFGDVVPDLSIASRAGTPGLLVLRSFGKFFGLAGLRLGFALGPASLVSRIAGKLGPWAVSGPALEIGAQAYADTEWITATRRRLAEDRQRLVDLLARHHLQTTGGTDLFVLVETDRAQAVWRDLAGQGVWSRLFEYRSDWLRLGLPGAPSEWDHLAAALANSA
jgi:cobalamin biosynthesis protein CobC